MSGEKKVSINPKFKPIVESSKRYYVVTGGRGSSKSFSVNTVLTNLLASERNQRVLFTRYTMSSAKISIVPEFLEKIELMKLDQYFTDTQNNIKCTVTGSDILFKGIKTSSGNQTAALKSIQGVTVWVLEEAEELLDEDTFDTIDFSIRSKKAANKVILVMNPTTKEHWVYKRWFENHLGYMEIEGERIPISTHPDIVHIHVTYLDNKENLSDTFLHAIEKLKTTNPKKYKHKILGGWLDKADGVVFENWTEGVFDYSLPYCYGLDLGYFPDPLAMVKVAVDEKAKKVYLKEIIYKTGLSYEEIETEIGRKVRNKKDLIISDTNEPRLTKHLQKKGFNVQKAKKGKGSIVDNIREMQDYQLIVDPGSYNLKKELNHYAWNDRKASIPIDDYNHLIDGARYGFVRLQKGKSNLLSL